MAHSRSSRALDTLLKEDGPIAEAIKSKFHRMTLWRQRKGLDKPRADSAAEMEVLSKGLIPANGWIDDEPAPSVVTKTSERKSVREPRGARPRGRLNTQE